MDEYLLGDFVKSYRTSHKLSLREFGALCGISHTTIDCIEKGFDPRTKKPVNITNTTFAKLSQATGVPVWVLVDLSVGIDDLHRVPGGRMSTSAMLNTLAGDLGERPLSELIADKKRPADGGTLPDSNVISVAGRDGSYTTKKLSDEQFAALKTLIDQLPDADDL